MTRRSPRSRRERAARPLTLVPAPAVTPGPGRRTRPVPESGPVVGSLCTGYGGLDLGVLAALGGGRIAWVADPDPHIAQILDARTPGIPNLGDLRHIDWASIEPVDVLVAGFPCQDISAAGKRAGIEKGVRSGLWADIVAGLRVLRPTLVVVENVAALRWRGGGLHRVLGDLAEAGYDALWRSVRAADVGAAHRRERVFLLAWLREPGPGRRGGDAADADRARRLLQWHQRRQQARRSVPAGPASVVADSTRLGHRDSGPQGRGGVPAAAVAAGASAGGPRGIPADAASDGRDEGLPGAAGVQGRPDAALGGHPPAHPAGASPGRGQRDRRHLVAVADPDTETTSASGVEPAPVNWGVYEAAIRRWEAVLGRPTPHPTQPGNHGRPVLAPAFVEHLIGLSVGLENDHCWQVQSSRRSLASGGPAAGAQQVSRTDSPATSDVTSNAGNPDDAARIDWSEYEPAIRRWEAIMGRPAPHPTEPGRHGRPVLSGRFVEFLMGLDDGFVSSLDIPRTAQLRALGNGVVPQQATHAIRLLLADLAAVSDLDSEGGWAA